MSDDKIVRLISNDEGQVGCTQSCRKEPRQFQLRVERAWSQRRFWRIQDNGSEACFNVIEQSGQTVSRKSQQTVIKVEIIDIDRFIFRRTNRKRMKIPNRDAAERISFNAKVRLQIFVCGITEHNSSTDC